MATSRRIERVASMIKREVSLMLLNGIKDDRVGAGMVSVTEVVVSGDLQHTKISIFIQKNRKICCFPCVSNNNCYLSSYQYKNY